LRLLAFALQTLRPIAISRKLFDFFHFSREASVEHLEIVAYVA